MNRRRNMQKSVSSDSRQVFNSFSRLNDAVHKMEEDISSSVRFLEMGVETGNWKAVEKVIEKLQKYAR